MSQATPPTDPTDPNSTPAAAASVTPPAKPKKRRRWPWVIGVILLLLVLLVVLLPTIASTGAVRSIVIGKVNDNLNGKLAVTDWSIGWFSGVTLDGVKVDDEKGRLVAAIGSVRVPASLIGLARGNYDFGEIVINDPSVNVEVYEDGSTNLD